MLFNSFTLINSFNFFYCNFLSSDGDKSTATNLKINLGYDYDGIMVVVWEGRKLLII